MHVCLNWNVSTFSISVFGESAPLMSRFTFPLSSRELEQKIHGRMSGPDHDDLLDFFDHTKPFKRVNLRQVSNKIGRWNYLLGSFLLKNYPIHRHTKSKLAVYIEWSETPCTHLHQRSPGSRSRRRQRRSGNCIRGRLLAGFMSRLQYLHMETFQQILATASTHLA